MAILSSLPGISVTVHNAQGQLPEYTDAEPDVVKNLKSPSSVVVSNYIEAPPDGGSFWLKFRVEAPYMHSPNGIMFRYAIPDTDNLTGRNCWPRDLENKESWEAVFKGYATVQQPNVFRSFQFAKLKILPADDQSIGTPEMEKSKMDSIGVFEVRILLGKSEYASVPNGAKNKKGSLQPKQQKPKIRNHPLRAPSGSTINNTPVTAVATEKIAAMKSLSLNLTYKDKPIKASGAYRGIDYSIIGGWHDPIAVFQFKYRTKVDLQRLLLIEKTPEHGQLPKEDLFPGLPTTLVPTLKQEPEQGRQTQEQRTVQPAQPAPRDLSAFATPTQFEAQKRGNALKNNQQPRTFLDGAAPLCSSLLDSTSRAFEELKFAEVRDLARKQYRCFDKLNGDEVEKFVRQKLAEKIVDADGVSPFHTSFDDLTFAEVWAFARNNYKDFDELNRCEIEELARQGYSHALTSPPATISGTPDERSGQGKRKASIKMEDTDDDVVFVKKTKLNSNCSYEHANVKREKS